MTETKREAKRIQEVANTLLRTGVPETAKNMAAMALKLAGTVPERDTKESRDMGLDQAWMLLSGAFCAARPYLLDEKTPVTIDVLESMAYDGCFQLSMLHGDVTEIRQDTGCEKLDMFLLLYGRMYRNLRQIACGSVRKELASGIDRLLDWMREVREYLAVISDTCALASRLLVAGRE